MEPVGLYFHVPFCAALCPYCDFFKKRPEAGDMEAYADRIKKELEPFRHRNIRADSVYFGGGTPSVLPGELLGDLLTAVRSCFLISEDAEITVECNPSSDLETFLPAAAEAGVNRLSFGLQSAVDGERRSLGRRADRARVETALDLARAAGFENLSLDVMLGVPGQTLQSLEDTLSFLKAQDVPHVSAYLLALEEGTVFAKRAARLDLPTEETVTALYRRTAEALEGAGLLQYEISNFAKPGFESRHNLKYWHCEEYLGFGPAAHSFFEGKRFYYPADWNAFLSGDAPLPDGDGGSFEERLMLAMRLREGYRGPVPEDLREKALQPELRPYLEVGEDFLRLTREGFLLSNTILSELL